jgi:hypothetical protein
MDVSIDAKDRVTLYIHNLKDAKDMEMIDATGDDGSIAERRFKFGNLEIIAFERE